MLNISVNLPSEKSYFENYNVSGKSNFYVEVQDVLKSATLSLGTWHILPSYLVNSTATNPSVEKILNITIIYFHGAGEARSYSRPMYSVLTSFFHVVAFDYRSKYKHLPQN